MSVVALNVISCTYTHWPQQQQHPVALTRQLTLGSLWTKKRKDQDHLKGEAHYLFILYVSSMMRPRLAVHDNSKTMRCPLVDKLSVLSLICGWMNACWSLNVHKQRELLAAGKNEIMSLSNFNQFNTKQQSPTRWAQQDCRKVIREIKVLYFSMAKSYIITLVPFAFSAMIRVLCRKQKSELMN